jgi:hypothetical protein
MTTKVEEIKVEEVKDEGIFKEYGKNIIEAFVILTIIRAIVDKPIDFTNILKSSIIIGLLICIATYINNEFKDNVRQGLHYGVSGIIISQFSPVV